ncbi:GIY-YIG nuclease family protein [Candidatus Uhrbacteria bacterium]|jgi:putative endonuclease|nr:GIY-YIG nuclease family protein [Candidatus Uhrbacteria bacterium]
MFYVYILEFSDREWYIGMTSDLKRRVQEHKAGSNKSTSYRGAFELMHYEAYRNKMDALGREKFLKSGTGRRFVKKQVRHYLEETENVTTK